ncbi:MAG: hypothetical protein JWL70_1300 [Acidimicrobiia bacterium]|nr:hypothetical protein [Acidimicrobiia bacterium]
MAKSAKEQHARSYCSPHGTASPPPGNRKADRLIWNVVVAAAVGIVLSWLILVLVLVVAKPDATAISSMLRLIPDTARLVRRLAVDRSVSRGVRIRLWFLLGYLALPLDIIPDFLPVIGYADDAIVISLVLRSVIKSAGADKIRQHWMGTPEGLATLVRLCRLPTLADTDPPGTDL